MEASIALYEEPWQREYVRNRQGSSCPLRHVRALVWTASLQAVAHFLISLGRACPERDQRLCGSRETAGGREVPSSPPGSLDNHCKKSRSKRLFLRGKLAKALREMVFEGTLNLLSPTQPEACYGH